jgi:hypothetical protein
MNWGETWNEEGVAKFEEVLRLSNRRTDKTHKKVQCVESVYDSMLKAQAPKLRSRNINHSAATSVYQRLRILLQIRNMPLFTQRCSIFEPRFVEHENQPHITSLTQGIGINITGTHRTYFPLLLHIGYLSL